MIELDLLKYLQGPQGASSLRFEAVLQDGEFAAVYGASGAGKTTLLRMIAGLTRPDAGRIVVDGEVWYDSARRIDLPVQRRRIGFVFQDYALFAHMSVRENLEFAAPERTSPAWIDEIVEAVQLGDLQDRGPDTLSGGQRQRVALARALARRPKLLLLDEPLSALDAATRLRLQEEILRLHRRFGTTALIVSHEPGEIVRLAGRIFVLEGGRVVRTGPPLEALAHGRISGKFRFTGEVLAITPNDTVYAVSVLVGEQLVTVIATAAEIVDVSVGDRVILISKAFNPLLMKLDAAAQGP